MKRINTQLYPLGLAAIALSLAGCTGLRSAADAPPTPAALQALEQVQTDYQAGRYGDVIKYVAKSDDLATAPASVRVPALKLQAFSYCVSKYVPLCEDTFSRILAIDPSFELSPSEAGHPVWGAAFKRVKN